MMEDISISQLFRGYGLDYGALDMEQRDALDRQGNVDDIKKTLDFLVNTMGVDPRRIEKCPSVLYFNTNCVERNFKKLLELGLNREKIVGCLHILSSEPEVLDSTYKYVRDHYGFETFNKNVSILGVPVGRIKEIEDKFSSKLNKQAILSAAITTLRMAEISTILMVCEEKEIEVTGSFFQKGVGEIGEIINIFQEFGIEIAGSAFRKSSYEVRKIINICQGKDVEVTGSVFLKDGDEVAKIIDTCRKREIPITGSVFRRDALEIDDICDTCEELGIEVSGTVFLRTADEIRRIHSVCQKYDIAITASVFKKSASEIEDITKVCERFGLDVSSTLFKKSAGSLEKSMEYVKNNYGSMYMTPLIVVTDSNHLQRVFPYLESKGTLPAVIASPAILTLKYDEMLEREKLISSIGEEDVVNERFNPIYGLSRKKYDEKTKSVTPIKGVGTK